VSSYTYNLFFFGKFKDFSIIKLITFKKKQVINTLRKIKI
jgi:hypothetical protein